MTPTGACHVLVDQGIDGGQIFGQKPREAIHRMWSACLV